MNTIHYVERKIMIESYNINLNIHYTTPQEMWDKLEMLYSSMPGWNAHKHQWYGNDEKIIEVSIEPSGLQFYAKLDKEEWKRWISEFKEKATEIMGYEVGEPEDGFEFQYYD